MKKNVYFEWIKNNINFMLLIIASEGGFEEEGPVRSCVFALKEAYKSLDNIEPKEEKDTRLTDAILEDKREMYDPDKHITAGELRFQGHQIPDKIPDCAFVRRDSIVWDLVEVKEGSEPTEIVAEMKGRFTQPFKWITVKVSLPAKEAIPPCPPFPEMGDGCQHRFTRTGVGWTCNEGDSDFGHGCRKYVHPGDEFYDEITAYYDWHDKYGT